MNRTERLERKVAKIAVAGKQVEALKGAKDARVKAYEKARMQQLLLADRQDARKEEADRKRRTHELLRRGLLLDKLGLSDMNQKVLRGALLAAKRWEGDLSKIGQWKRRGIAILAQIPGFSGKKRDSTPTQKRNWIEAGTVFEKAGMLDWDLAVLAQILVFVAAGRERIEKRKSWISNNPVEVDLDDTNDIVVRFARPIAPDLARELRTLGLKFDREEKIWFGTASPSTVQELTDHATISTRSG